MKWTQLTCFVIIIAFLIALNGREWNWIKWQTPNLLYIGCHQINILIKWKSIHSNLLNLMTTMCECTHLVLICHTFQLHQHLMQQLQRSQNNNEHVEKLLAIKRNSTHSLENDSTKIFEEFTEEILRSNMYTFHIIIYQSRYKEIIIIGIIFIFLTNFVGWNIEKLKPSIIWNRANIFTKVPNI